MNRDTENDPVRPCVPAPGAGTGDGYSASSGRLLSMKELGWELNRSYSYICAMKRAGFPMPGGRATLAEAREWLRRNPGFSFAAVYIRKDFPALPKTRRKSVRRQTDVRAT